MQVTPEAESKLLEEYHRIEKKHAQALQMYAARVVLGPSVMRVFVAKTMDDIRPLLGNLPVKKVAKLKSQAEYRAWFNANTQVIAESLALKNARNSRVNPGLQWGHATKILALLMRDMVLSSRLFTEVEAERLAPWLYAPIDSIVIKRLRGLRFDPGFKRIKDIDTAEKFYGVQGVLGAVAKKVGVPRVWFDDNWGDRQ
jgi:hypothetical protein